MDAAALADRVHGAWDADVLPSLEAYIAIPALSPAFDADWRTTGHLATATEHIRAWSAARSIRGLTVTVHELDGRTPVIICDVPPFGGAPDDDTVLLYGHLDKQPPMEGWIDGLGPWTPVRRGPRLYGRGGADDGYSAYAALTAIEGVQRAGGTHARCVVLIEAC
ncbi:MAG: M20/M25/M40 family metallo-hydrolase, partial [Actinomycetota bacterium]|nr:M20/M25/M40 family metallo-hydrolase [Actinomycetota bacterium]